MTSTFRSKNLAAFIRSVSIVLLAIGIMAGAGLFIQHVRWDSPGSNGAPIIQAPPQVRGSLAAAAQPVFISIPTISVDAPMVPLGLNSDQTLQVPAGDNQVGWYQYGALPGQKGTAVLVGHLDSTTGPAIFWHLKDVRIGDHISITRSDGTTAVFSVTSVHAYPFDSFPSTQIYAMSDNPTLQIITCTGTYSRTTHHYSDNLVVSATLDRIDSNTI